MVGGAGGAGVGSGVLVVLVVHRARRRGSAGVQAVHAKRNGPLPRWEHVGSGVDRGGHWGRGLERAAPAREDEETMRVGSPAEADERRIGLGSTLMPTAGSAFSWSILFLMAAPYAVVGAAGGWLFYLYRATAACGATTAIPATTAVKVSQGFGSNGAGRMVATPLPAGRLIRAWHADTTGVGRGTTSSSPMPTLSTHANIF